VSICVLKPAKISLSCPADTGKSGFSSITVSASALKWPPGGSKG
ncbi:hypothetical protein SOVF_211340, partial [Spinacia oleracea]